MPAPRVIILGLTITLGLVAVAAPTAAAQPSTVDARLRGFDAYMQKVIADWNVPGIAVGIVVKDRLVFAKGYGYRDYGAKLPLTPTTTMPIASNTKLFTSVAAGLLVEEGKLDWDRPVRSYVPSIQFANDDLNRTVTIRDMLSHRTGITRHDGIWYKSDFDQKALFDRIRYLEPTAPLRSRFIYNNMMYVGAGYATELLSGRPWEAFVRERLLEPLGMTSTTFSIAEMRSQADHAIPYTERRDGTELYRAPFYEEDAGVAPAGAMVSNVRDMSRWVIALINGGRVDGRQVIPASVIRETLAPSVALPNVNLELRGWGELLNAYYGMGRWVASYRGRPLAYHGGDLPGFHSQVSVMPYDSIGVIVLVIGDHAAPLYNVVSWNVYERLLGLSLTPWSERLNTIRLANKEAGKQARARAGGGRVMGTRPTHDLDDYVGEFAHPAYGVLKVARGDTTLELDFRKSRVPLNHFHYNRFDTPDDERDGMWSVNFLINPQGEIDRAEVSLDEKAVAFERQVPAELTAVETLRRYTGTYVAPNGARFEAVIRPDSTLALRYASGTYQNLVPYRPHVFRIREFPDVRFAFTIADGQVVELTQVDPSGGYRFTRAQAR
jgi:CubicO group peptidase (beta-lactamase class C family)